MIEVRIRPTLWANIAKKFVLIKYPIESGMNTVPICHFCELYWFFHEIKLLLLLNREITSGFRVAINQIGKHGSNMAMAIVETNMAPTISNIIGSDNKLV